METGYIFFDFEVFKHDVLLGAKVRTKDDEKVYQIWDKEKIKEFYFEHENFIWIGHNNSGYDNPMLDGIINGKDPFQISCSLIGSSRKFRPQSKTPKYWYDLMNTSRTPFSLKVTELYSGENISETQVDFNIDRPLTEEEKKLTESYNRDDLNRTEANFELLRDGFDLRLSIIKEFNLPMSALHVTGTKLAAIVLGAHAISGIENMIIKPHMYKNLKLKNQDLIDFYMNEDFRKGKKLEIELCGAKHQIGQGGIHAALERYHTKRALYFDVSGYYNLTMINFDLLPRTLGENGKKKYEYMYHEQLRLKKIDPQKRSVYKTILLSVFGAMGNEYTDFYDPQKLLLVTITGQLFLVDLLEKLEGKVRVVQSNTDGIIVEPFDWSKKDEIVKIVEEWEARTGYVIKKEEITDIWQRDVNCYVYRKNGEIEVVGEAVKDYGRWDHNMFWKSSFDSKEPAIFAECIVNFLMNGVKPEDTIEKFKTNLIPFQYVVKKKSFDYTEIQTNFADGSVEIEKLQGVNRAFPSVLRDRKSTIYKCRSSGKVTRAKVANVPENVFVYDGDIRIPETIEKLNGMIDWDYYTRRAYEKIDTFLRIPVIKELKLLRHCQIEQLYI